MKGTLKENFLELDCNMNNFILFPNGPENAGENCCTNVCGLAQINGKFYCAKTNASCKTGVYEYTTNENFKWITTTPINYYCIDIAAYGNELLLLGRTSTSLNGQSVIIRMTTKGTIQKIYTVDFDAIGLSFYKHDENNMFMVLHNSTDNVNLKIEVGSLNDTSNRFVYDSSKSLNLQNTGYTYRIQGIHYADGPLLVITNNDYNTCQNAIMVYSNFYCPKDSYRPIAKFYVKPASSSYTQFNIESACADEEGTLTIAMNCNGPSSAYGDAVKKIPINLVNNRFEVELDLNRGVRVPNLNSQQAQCNYANFGTMALDGNELYGIKTAAGDSNQILFKTKDYTDYSATGTAAQLWNKLTIVKEFSNTDDESKAILNHANGMELCNNHLFICGKGIERLTLDGEYTKRYTTTFTPKGIAWLDSVPAQGLFYVFSSTRNNCTDGYKYYPLHKGKLTGTQYTNDEIIGYVRIGLIDVENGPIKEGTQDIINRDGIGLFIVYNMGERNDAGTYPVKKSALLHVDVDSITTWDNKPRVIPDYALTITSEDVSLEIESGAFDETKNRLVLCSNYGGGDGVWYTNSNWVFDNK